MIRKIILITALCLSASALKAQETSYSPYPYRLGLGMEFGYGSAFDFTIRAQYHFNKYITWDILQLRDAEDFSSHIDTHKCSELMSLTTGVHAYSPSFGHGFKGFASAGMGWGYYQTMDKAIFFRPTADSYSKTHNFAADFSAGLFVWQGVYVSYGCQLLHNNSHGNQVNHFANIGFELGSFKFKK